MKTAARIGIGVAVFFLLTFISCGGYIMSTYNTCIELEKRIEAQYKNNQNVYDTFWKTVKEIAQVPEMYAEDTKKLYKEVLSNRYGKDGSKAMFQFLKEQNPNLDASLYKKIQQAIESGRTDFKKNQTVLIDIKAQYEMYINKFPRVIFARMFGFPRINLKEFDIVTSEETSQAFTTKKAGAIKLK